MKHLLWDFPWRDTFLSPHGVSLAELTAMAQSLANWTKEQDKKPFLIALSGDLWAGKTTFSQSFIQSYLEDKSVVITSPTYTYYRVYGEIVHADLYRCRSYDDFVWVGGEETFDHANVILVEWPSVILPYYQSDLHIELSAHPSDLTRRVITIR